MIVRNKIWEEIKEADVFYRGSIEYASVQRKIQFAYKVTIPILAGLCILFTKLNMPDYSLWVAIIIFVSTILKSFFTQIILSEKNIERLDQLGVDFENYRKKIENLMRELDNRDITDEEASKELDKHQTNFNKKKAELNKLVLWIPIWKKKQLQASSDEYLQKVHYNNYN